MGVLKVFENNARINKLMKKAESERRIILSKIVPYKIDCFSCGVREDYEQSFEYQNRLRCLERRIDKLNEFKNRNSLYRLFR